MPRRKRSRGKPQRSKRHVALPNLTDDGRVRKTSRGVQLAALVKGDGKCYNELTARYKIAFNTEEKAAQALAAARKNHQLLGHVERIEERYYLCPIGDRGGAGREHYHLTHKPGAGQMSGGIDDGS